MVKKGFQPAFRCAQHFQARQNTQHPNNGHLNNILIIIAYKSESKFQLCIVLLVYCI